MNAIRVMSMFNTNVRLAHLKTRAENYSSDQPHKPYFGSHSNHKATYDRRHEMPSNTPIRHIEVGMSSVLPLQGIHPDLPVHALCS